ncbi:cysteine proteinase [Gigaspora margarita]|uniref:Cysteine proteinase n=1 Tax=Gigaspora margarita TaxID=4874 RepID=A0A8H4ETN1_GIGMA|nr:cysteine proteinase [Gigaspora margarita]
MEDLTGGVYTSIFTSDIYKTDIFWNELKRNVRNKTMLYACARYQNANLDTKGTQKGHAYSILRAEEIMVEEISDEKLVKLKELVKIETASEDDKKKELIKLAEEFMETHKELKGLDDKFKDHREKLIGQVENIENDKQREKLKKLVEEIEDVKKHAKLKKLVEKFKNETLQVLIEEIADHKNRDKYKELVENLENEEKCDRIDKLVEEIANKEKREKITTLFEKIVDCEKRKRLKEMVIEDEKLKPLVELIVDKSEKCLENQVEEIKDDEIREELKKLLNKIENDGKREKLTELADKIVDECKNLEDLVDEIEEVIDDVEKREELKELVEEIEDTREKLKNLVEEIVDGKKREKLILIRNPYGGRPGWFGAWSDGSKEWTPECMKALGYKFGNDGAFWMTYEDFLQYWSVIDTCRLFDENWKIYQTWINYNVDPQSDGKFMLHVTEKCELVIVLQQPDDRYFIDPPKSNYLLSFRLYKENEKDVYDHNEYLYRSRLSVTYGPRSTNLQLDYLPRGKYVIIPDVDRKIKKNSGSSPSNTNLKVNVHAKTHNNVDLTVTTNDGESGNTPKNEKISDVKKRKKVLLDGYALNDEVDKSDENTKDNNWEMELGLRIYSKKEISLKGISGKCPK